MTLVFADTFYWIALTNPKDSDHRRVLHLGRSFGSRIIVTIDEVLTEFLAFCASESQLRVQAALAVQYSRRSGCARSSGSFFAGLELYLARPDKGYILTDCISMQTMRREGLAEVLTNDRHFQQEGFRALFRDS